MLQTPPPLYELLDFFTKEEAKDKIYSLLLAYYRTEPSTDDFDDMCLFIHLISQEIIRQENIKDEL
jgi:hypothetical protein